MKYFLALLLIITITTTLSGCSVKVKEADAKRVMQAIYKTRKSGNIGSEFKYYAKKDFKIVTFEQAEKRFFATMDRAGNLQKVRPLKAEIQNRNQLNEGLVKYLVLSYEASYANLTLYEYYYFHGDSKKPKLVYFTFIPKE